MLAAALGLGCGDAGAPSPPESAPGPTQRSTAHPELVEALRADLAAERHPGDGGGRAWLEASEPERPRAGESGRFVLVYEAGPEGVAVGGSVQLQVSPFWDWSTPQTADPGAPGYTEVSTEATGVELAPVTLDQQLLGIEVRGRALAEGERVRVVYGAGPAGARVDRYAERESPFFFAVDADGDGVRSFVPDSPTVDLRPGPAAQLRLHGPATARPGETLRFVVAVLDRFGNAGVPFEGRIELEPPAPGLEAPAAVELGAADAGRRSFRVVAAAPGIHRLRARGPDGLEAESPPLRVDAAGPRILWGDLHGHSVLSDGTGTPEDYYAYARDVAALDVAALTDHDHWGMPFLDRTPENWARIQAATRSFHEPGRFVTLHGYEWTSWIFGHRHVLFFGDEAALHSSIDEATDEPGELWSALRGSPALTFAHHSAGGPVATDWSIPPDPELEPVTEVVSVHGSSEALDAPRSIYSPVPGNFVRDVVARGYRLGFVGSGDGHDGHPGLTHLAAGAGGLAGILAAEPTRAAVLEALRARRCYATSGPRILLDVRLAGRPMGSVVPPGAHPLEVRVAAPVEIERVDLVTGAGVQSSLAVEGERDLHLQGETPELAPGEALYVRVVQRDGGAAWSSPFFVEAGAGATR